MQDNLVTNSLEQHPSQFDTEASLIMRWEPMPTPFFAFARLGKMPDESRDVSAGINAIRFKKRALAVLKTASVEGTDGSTLNQIRMCVDHLSRHRPLDKYVGVDRSETLCTSAPLSAEEAAELGKLVLSARVVESEPAHSSTTPPSSGKAYATLSSSPDAEWDRSDAKVKVVSASGKLGGGGGGGGGGGRVQQRESVASGAIGGEKSRPSRIAPLSALKLGRELRPSNKNADGAGGAGDAYSSRPAAPQDATSALKIQALLQQSKHIDAQELEKEQRSHLELLGHITDMVGNVKFAAMEMALHVGQQNIALDQIAEAATGNMEELHAQREKMKTAIEDMSGSTWTTLGTLAWLLGMFFVTYGIIRLFPNSNIY